MLRQAAFMGWVLEIQLDIQRDAIGTGVLGVFPENPEFLKQIQEGEYFFGITQPGYTIHFVGRQPGITDHGKWVSHWSIKLHYGSLNARS